MGTAIKVDYDMVRDVAAKLSHTAEITVPKLTTLKTQVSAMLQVGGGLYLVKSSPLLSSKYDAFNNSITEAVNSIPSWAAQFTTIIGQIQDLDDGIFDSMNAN
ncbi:hypothetical protein [Kineosporia sp. NBRC 101731]|uniref:hypothetical protein n=1 Tax=Kineosporia sp. NBRC 101731 TaxID=3032199 RepID=UPI0024A356D2|nr:hypothetical protein [Kineosporia sp. NBRC 101731]GLY28861.1 hypothetical protein Kisp02_22260 [Kineosporia sp. NBRC 101731]